VSPSGSPCLALFAYALSFLLLAVITALTLCPVLSHTNSVYGELHFALLLMITTPAQKFFFKPSHQLTVVEQLNRFDVDVVEEPFFLLLSELSSFIRNHLHLKIPMEIGVSDIPRCIKGVPMYLVLKSLNDVSVARFCASPQLYAAGPRRLQYLFVQHHLIMHRQGRSSSHEPIEFLVF